MEKKMSHDDVISLLGHVIRTIDIWWIETTNLEQGFFTRSNINNSLVTHKDYVEWRYSETIACTDYVSMFISLEYEGGTDYIRMTLRKLKNGVYTEYDPFCEIHDGKTDVVISKDTGGYDALFSVFGKGWINDLTDDIATTVCRFTKSPYDEEEASVNMDDVSKTLSTHDIQDCMIKAVRIMLVDRDTVNELIRLRSKYAAQDQLTTTQCENMLGYSIEATSKHVVTRIIYDNTFVICSFICGPDTHGPHEFIIRYNSRDTGFKYEQGFNILYKNPDDYCFEYAADGLNVDKIFKPFVNILRNTLNYELYQSRFQDTTITAPEGLMTKEVFVLDTSYFVIGDIYLLEIDPKYDWSKISTTPIKIPQRVYAICEDVCSTVIDFMLGGIEGRDGLLRIQVHADEIEDGLVTVKRVLMNESLEFSKEDKQNA
jgi:hypothetical protein